MEKSKFTSVGCVVLILVFSFCICVASVLGVMYAISQSPEFSNSFEYKQGDLFNQVAVIDISGPIIGGQSTDLLGNILPDPVNTIIQNLEKAKSDSTVKAVILRFNTGGGTVYDSFKIADEVRNFKNDTDKPIIALVETSSASGGYLIASQTDYIFSHETSILGSIGVIAEITDTEGLMNKLGIDTIRITSDGAEQKSGEKISNPNSSEYKNLKELLNDYQKLFNEYVAEGRGLGEAEVKKLADGSVSSGVRAQERKLIDEHGDLDAAVTYLENKLNIKNLRVFIYLDKEDASLGLLSIVNKILPSLNARSERGIEVIF